MKTSSTKGPAVRTKATPAKRVPVRLAMVMSDGTLEPVELDEEGISVEDLMQSLLDNPSDRSALCDAVRAAVRRFR